MRMPPVLRLREILSSGAAVLQRSEPCPLGFEVLWTGHREIGSDLFPGSTCTAHARPWCMIPVTPVSHIRTAPPGSAPAHGGSQKHSGGGGPFTGFGS